MRIIHCADLHLDSSGIAAAGDREKSERRKKELLDTFCRMVQWAAENSADAVLMAGDIFDRDTAGRKSAETVLYQIKTHPEIRFYYLKGNHDRKGFYSRTDDIPDNLKLFSDTWTSYEEKDGVVIHGLEISGGGAGNVARFEADMEKINIVMLHGQVREGAGDDSSADIDIRELRNRGIDYLALGHVHRYMYSRLDSRGICCYSGCLEGRGFDDTGEHGFVLLDIDSGRKTVRGSFIPSGGRKIMEVSVDITGAESSGEVADRAEKAIAEAGGGENDMVQLVLEGDTEIDSDIEPEYVAGMLEWKYFGFRIKDRSRRHIDEESYMMDISLKGEFLRRVMADRQLNEEEKILVAREGIAFLEGRKGKI